MSIPYICIIRKYHFLHYLSYFLYSRRQDRYGMKECRIGLFSPGMCLPISTSVWHIHAGISNCKRVSVHSTKVVTINLTPSHNSIAIRKWHSVLIHWRSNCKPIGESFCNFGPSLFWRHRSLVCGPIRENLIVRLVWFFRNDFGAFRFRRHDRTARRPMNGTVWTSITRTWVVQGARPLTVCWDAPWS